MFNMDKMLGDFIKNNLAGYLQNNWRDLIPIGKKLFNENKETISNAVLENKYFQDYKNNFEWVFMQSVLLELIIKKEFGNKYDELFNLVGKKEFKEVEDLENTFDNFSKKNRKNNEEGK